jgi:SEC-C motif-containing protein
MRARYSAFATGDLEFIWRTWHPRTRPQSPAPDTGVEWTGLEIVDVVAGQPGDADGTVEFRAHHRDGEQRSGRSAPDVAGGTLHERSRFAWRARRWFYVDGELLD